MVSIEVQGFEAIEKRLKTLELAVSTEAILDEATAIILNRVRDRFLRETAPDGSKWIPSKASEQRAKRGRGGGTLFDTGRLFHSIQLSRVGEGFREISTDVPYALQHQLGLNENLERPFIGISDEDSELIMNYVSNRIAKALSNV